MGTCFVYIFLYIACLGPIMISRNIRFNRVKLNWRALGLYLSIVSFSFIVGLRWDVGVDYMTYYELASGYFSQSQLDRIEPFARYTAQIVYTNGFPFYVWFILMAFLQYFFVIKSVDRDKAYLLSYIVFFYLCYMLAFSMNIVRQAVAFSILLYAYNYIYRKKFFHYAIWCIIAALFHKSALLMLPFYFFANINLNISALFQIMIMLLFFVMGQTIISEFLSSLSNLWVLLGYEGVVNRIEDQAKSIEVGGGLGIVFNYLKYGITILFSEKLKKTYTDCGFNVFYNLFFIGVCIYGVTMMDMYLSRLSQYFLMCDIVVSSFLMHYLFKVKRTQVNRLLGIALLLMIAFIAIYSLSTSQEWKFI